MIGKDIVAKSCVKNEQDIYKLHLPHHESTCQCLNVPQCVISPRMPGALVRPRKASNREILVIPAETRKMVALHSSVRASS